MAEIDDILPGDAGKEILVPARKADHFVRKDRAAHQQMIVIQDQAVETYGYALMQQAAADAFHLGRSDHAHLSEHLWIVPGVVEEVNLRVLRCLFSRSHPHQCQQLCLTERRMRPQRHQEIDLAGSALQRSHDGAKEERQRHGSGGVGDEHQYPFALDWQ